MIEVTLDDNRAWSDLGDTVFYDSGAGKITGTITATGEYRSGSPPPIPTADMLVILLIYQMLSKTLKRARLWKSLVSKMSFLKGPRLQPELILVLRSPIGRR